MITPVSARLISGLSKKDLAEKLDIPEPDYEHYEINPDKMPVNVAIRLAQIYRVSIDIFDFN